MELYAEVPFQHTEGVLYYHLSDISDLPELDIAIMSKVNKVVDTFTYVVSEDVEEWVVDKNKDRFLGWLSMGSVRLPLDYNNQDVLEFIKQHHIDYVINQD